MSTLSRLLSRRDRRRDGDDARELWWWGHLCLSVDRETEERVLCGILLCGDKVKSFARLLSQYFNSNQLFLCIEITVVS
jgi:hypothetical protein